MTFATGGVPYAGSQHWATSLSLSYIGEGNGNPLQCSCLENPRDGGAWWAAVCGIAQSQTRLKRFSSSSSKVLAVLPLCLVTLSPSASDSISSSLQGCCCSSRHRGHIQNQGGGQGITKASSPSLLASFIRKRNLGVGRKRINLEFEIYKNWLLYGTQTVKNLRAMQKTQVQSLGWKDTLEKGMATHSSILAWEIPWTEEPSGLQSIVVVVQSLSPVWLFATPWTAAGQTSVSFTISLSLLKLMSTCSTSVMPSNHLILCHPLFLLNLSQHQGLFQWVRSSHQVTEYWSVSVSNSPSNEYTGLISFRIDWFDFLAVQETLKSLFKYHSLKASIIRHSAFFMVQLTSIHDYWKNHSSD